MIDESIKNTTVACDEQTRAYIASEARALGYSQRELLAIMVDHYKERSATIGPDGLNSITDDIIEYLHRQEKELFLPILTAAVENKTLLQALIDILKKVDNNVY